MIKKSLLVLGILACVLAVFPLVRYIFDYQQLSEYGRGYIWGKILLLLLGISLIVLSRFKKT